MQFPPRECAVSQARMSGCRVGSEQAPTSREAMGKFPHTPGLCFPICKMETVAGPMAVRGTSGHVLSVQEVSAAMALVPPKIFFFFAISNTIERNQPTVNTRADWVVSILMS